MSIGKDTRPALWILLSAFCAATASAAEPTILYEAPVETNAPPRTEVVVNVPMALKKSGGLVLDLWSLDDGEEPVVISVKGGKGANGKKRGIASEIDELPPSGGGLRHTFPGGRLRRDLDASAMSNVVVRIESGRPQRFGISRIFVFADGEKLPELGFSKLPRRHPRDAAEHAEDFAKFKEECATGDFVVGWATSMENVRPRGGFKWRKPDKVGVRLARGEYESVQILVAPNGKDLKDVQVALEGDLKPVENGSGFAATNVAANVVGYTETIHPPPYVVRPTKGGRMKRPPCGWYPDPILDFQKSCDVSGDDVQSFWVRVKCPRDQEAGVYEGALVVSAEGVEPVRIPFSVRVNGFEVGLVSPLPLAISTNPGAKQATNHWSNAWRMHREETCDFFADYFITFDRLFSGEPAWDMLERLKGQGRLNTFNLRYVGGLKPGWEGVFRERVLTQLQARYDKAKELGIEKHAYIFSCDEIGYNEFTNLYLAVEELHKAFPDVPVITTAKDGLLGTKGSLVPNVNMFCPPTCWWNPARVDMAHREGRKVWWYFCNNPASPWANMTLEGPPCEIRSLMGAQTQKFKPDGFLYWATTSWYSKNPIKEGPFTDWEPRSFFDYHGDGQWVCCGGPDNMFLPTIRLENFRDGIEDLWYVRTLEKLYAARRDEEMVPEEKTFKEGGEIAESDWCRRAREVLAVPNDVAKDLREFSTTPDVIYRWRDEMADLIESNLQGNN